MNKLIITVQLPNHDLHPNARVHWARKARETKAARSRASDAAMLAMLDTDGFNAQTAKGKLAKHPRWAKASIRATFYVKDRRGISADEDGRVSSLKPVLDGLEDAGVVENDSGFRWLSPPIVHEIDRLNPRVELEVTEIAP